MGFWNNVLEGLKLVRIWEDDMTFINTQSIEDMCRVIQENVKKTLEEENKSNE